MVYWPHFEEELERLRKQTFDSTKGAKKADGELKDCIRVYEKEAEEEAPTHELVKLEATMDRLQAVFSLHATGATQCDDK